MPMPMPPLQLEIEKGSAHFSILKEDKALRFEKS
jgi:hypothetical protein